MIRMESVSPGRVFLGRLEKDTDLLEELNAFCRGQEIRLGRVEALGAVRQARLGYYHQEAKTYEFREFRQPLEIVSLSGNVSLKDGQPFVHAHIVLADAEGHAFGGHLAPGTIVFACEVLVQEWAGPPLQRTRDEPTGLPLWE